VGAVMEKLRKACVLD